MISSPKSQACEKASEWTVALKLLDEAMPAARGSRLFTKWDVKDGVFWGENWQILLAVCC
jgi:hypothetical protein